MRIERREGYRIVVGGPVPKGSSGMTIGSTVFVRAGHEDSSHLLRHELVHVQQWRDLGVVGFLARYLTGYAHGRLRGYNHRQAYLRIPLEIEAEWVADRAAVGAARRASARTDR